MDRDFNTNNYMGNYQSYDPFNYESNPYDTPPMFNPMSQYEQTYMYYRSLNEQLTYKIKSKQYERMCNSDKKQDRKIE